MLARFEFFVAKDDPSRLSAGRPVQEGIATQGSGRHVLLRCQTDPGFARGNYGSHNFTHVGITFWPLRTPTSAENLNAETDAMAVPYDGMLLMRGRGEVTPHGGPDELYFITICQISERDAPRFLDQFVIARRYIQSQPGFIRHHLFESNDPRVAIRFVNLAAWRSLEEFVTAFTSPNFKKLIKGGFDRSSQIIVARRLANGMLQQNTTIGGSHS